MKLSEYIAALQTIARECKNLELGDPTMAMQRHSDLTDDVDPPEMIVGLPPADGREWIMRTHPTMPEADKEKLRFYVYIPGGN